MMMPEGCVGKHCYRACYQDEVLIYACYRAAYQHEQFRVSRRIVMIMMIMMMMMMMMLMMTHLV